MIDGPDTQPIQRVEARSRRPGGAPIWLGPVLGFIIGLCGLIGFGLYLGARPIEQTVSVQSTAIVITITPAPIIPTATTQPTLPPTATPQGLYIGGVAIVTGTGSALRLRSDPGLQSTTLKTVADGTRLTILEGPRTADELIWWRLRDPADGAEGWAAQDYLSP